MFSVIESTALFNWLVFVMRRGGVFNPLNAELNPIRRLLALVGARHIVHVSRVRVNVR